MRGKGFGQFGLQRLGKLPPAAAFCFDCCSWILLLMEIFKQGTFLLSLALIFSLAGPDLCGHC